MDFAQISEYVLLGLGIATLLVPAAQKIASLTKNTTDDEWVARVASIVEKALEFIPTVLPAKLTPKSDKQIAPAIEAAQHGVPAGAVRAARGQRVEKI